MYFPLKLFLFLIPFLFPNSFLCVNPITTQSFRFFTGQEIIEPQLNTLYYASPSPYLYSYDNYSQKIKSVHIETGEFNVFHQVNFKIGQMLFFPQGLAFIHNVTAGNQLIKWNTLASFLLEKTSMYMDMNSFTMSPFYPVYDQLSSEPYHYFLVYNQTKLEVLTLDGQIVSSVTNEQLQLASVCGFPEQGVIITGNTLGQIRLWNFTAGNPLNNTFNFTEYHPYSVEFLERGINSRVFLSIDNTEKRLRIWSLDTLNQTKMLNVSFGDFIVGIKSISTKTAVVYGNGQSFDYINVETGTLISSIKVINVTIVALDVLSLSPKTRQERIAVLTSDGKVTVYVLSQTSGVVSLSYLFTPKFPQIKRILFATTFKRRNSDNTATSIMGIVSNTSNKTIYFIDEKTVTNVSSFTYSTEIRGLYQIMGRYLPVFQDMMLIWYGNSYSVYAINEDKSIVSVHSYTSPTGKTIVNLELLYQIQGYAYAYVSVIDQYNYTTILNITGTNLTSFKIPEGIKFFCKQNFFSNFAYSLKNDTIVLKSINETNFSVSDFPLAFPIVHPNMTDCFSKNIINGGYYMTSNSTITQTWMYDGTLIFNKNFTNITSLVIEGNPLFTAINNYDNYIYEAITGVGVIANYSVGFAPKRNGFLFQFLENYFYSVNERELTHFYMNCPFGSTVSNAVLGACFPNCNNSFISLTNTSCITSCLDGTYATPIFDAGNNFYSNICQNINSTILNCQAGVDLGNYTNKCQKCEGDYFLLATNATNSLKYSHCAYNKLDGRIATKANSLTDGTGIAKWCNQFINNCYYCNWSPSHCDICEWTFFRQLDGLCNNCSNNTEFHNGSLNGTGFCYNCSVAMPYCYICNGNSTNCTECFRNYYFDEQFNLSCTTCSSQRYAKIGKKDGTGFCRNCSDVINNCIDCSEFGEKCTLCEDKLYIDVDYNCTNCSEINKYPYGLTSGTGLCKYCNSSLSHCLNCYGNPDDCQLCMNDYYFYSDKSCVDCLQTNYFFNGSNNGSGGCYDCYLARPNCNECNNDPNHCDLCFNNYFFDENNTCSSCNRANFTTMYKNGSFNGSGLCLYCKDAINDCNECTDNATACTHCDISFYIVYKNLTCTDCLANTNFYNGSNDGYSICYPCGVAYNNCKTCDYPANRCLICDEDYFLNEFYRCQPYTFRPEYTNTSIINSSLTFSIVNNRRYAVFENPCDYNRSQWSLDSRLHSYWIASLNHDKVDKFTLWDIEYIVNPLKVNETRPNYTDTEWNFYGNSDKNSLVITGKHNSHYKVKYFCVYGNTFSDETKPGIFDFYFPDNTGDEGLIFINMDGMFTEDSVDKALPIVACALQHLLKLGDTNQISTENDKKCPIHVDSINISNSSISKRLLQTAFVESDASSMMTYILKLEKNMLLVKDTSATLIQNEISLPSFPNNLSLYIKAFDSIDYLPNTSSAEFIISTDMNQIKISFPTIEPVFFTFTNKSGKVNFTINGNDGVLLMGIEKNNSLAQTPSIEQLKKGVNGLDDSLDYYSRVLVKEKQKFNLNMTKMNPAVVYAFYYVSQNLYATNTSEVQRLLFSTNVKIIEIIEDDTDNKGSNEETNIMPIVVGVVVGVVGLIIIIIIVCCVIYRIKMRNEEKDEEEEKKNKYTEVNKNKNLKPSRPGDVILPSVEAFPSSKDVLKLETEEKKEDKILENI